MKSEVFNVYELKTHHVVSRILKSFRRDNRERMYRLRVTINRSSTTVLDSRRRYTIDDLFTPVCVTSKESDIRVNVGDSDNVLYSVFNRIRLHVESYKKRLE